MPNPLSQFFQERFIQPAVDAQVEKALAGKHPVAYGVGTMPEISLERAIGQPHDANYVLLYALYKLNTDVSGCVHKWAGGVTGSGWRITTMEEDIKPSEALDNDIRDITRWLKNPNPFKLFESMLYEGVEHFGISGDFYWYVSTDSKGRPLELWPMHPALTKIVATKQGEVLGYIMRAPGEDPVYFDEDEVLHFPLPNPTNDLYGESPLELVLEEAGIDLQALRSNKALFQNGMNPSAVLLMNDTAKAEDARAMTEMLKQSHTGSGNQHKIVALSKTNEFKPWTMTNRDLEFLKLRDLATSKVTTAYRIPKVLLGHHNAGDYATTKFLIRDTYNHVYRPMQRIIEEVITERLIHRFNPELRFQLIPPDASDPDDVRKDQMQAKRDGILSADEVRGDSFGKDPLPGPEGDTPSEDDQKPDADAGNTAEDAPETGKSIKKSLADDRAAEMLALADGIEPAIVEYFLAQQQGALDAMPETLGASGLDGYLDVALEGAAAGLLAVLSGSLYSSLMAGTQAAQLQLGITLTFGQINPYVQQYLDAQALQHVQGISNTTREQLRVQLSEGIAKEESVDQLANRVRSVFTEATEQRAKLIASSETAQAFQFANYQAAEATGLTLNRTWLTAPEGPCPVCEPLNGYTIRFEAHYPDDVEPGFIHPGCRCTETYEVRA
jgi:HK97 family phage portal protein